MTNAATLIRNRIRSRIIAQRKLEHERREQGFYLQGSFGAWTKETHSVKEGCDDCRSLLPQDVRFRLNVEFATPIGCAISV